MLALFTCGLILMFLFPPYFGIDRSSNGQVHASVGYHPVWDPPDREHVLSVLSETGLASEADLQLSNLEVGRNNVLLGIQTLGLYLLSLVGFLASRTRRGERREKGSDGGGP